MKMHSYFLLNIKHGASQFYWGPPGSNSLAPALQKQHICTYADILKGKRYTIHCESKKTVPLLFLL